MYQHGKNAQLSPSFTTPAASTILFPNHRTFVYSLLMRGKPFPLSVMVTAGLFCALNGFLQGHYLLHCAQFDDEWFTGYCFKIGKWNIYSLDVKVRM